ncbi:MAG: LPS assembly protein LptD [Pseudomonadota bacterium]|nr:LPS assembly protein LptD [Pseudomonadota bacterium]
MKLSQRLSIAAAVASMILMQSAALAKMDRRSDQKTPVVFKADQLRNEQELGIVVATGNVEFTQGERTLMADVVTYNRREDTVAAKGNVSILEPTGEVIFADRVKVTGDLRDGIMENMRVRLADGARIAAAGGRKIGGEKTEFRKAVYSPCELCEEDPSRAPLWQVKAFNVIHDQTSRDVIYKDAFMEVYGLPVIYTPYLSHPGPTVKRRTGFLVPTYGSDTDLGQSVTTPYYIDISPNMDATLTPTFSDGEGVIAAGELRHRLSSTIYRLDGSGTYGSKDSGDKDTPRGHIRGDLLHEFDRTWRGGADIFLSTDDTSLRRYNIDSTDTLENRFYVEGFRGRSYAAANAYYFQGLRATDNFGNTPIVFPKLDYNYVAQPDRFGGQWSVDAGFLALTRTDGTDSKRLSGITQWQLPYTTRHGEVYRFFSSLQTDAYLASGVVDSDDPNRALSGFSYRLFPQAGMDWRLPLARKDGRFTQIVEPVVGVILAPNGKNTDRIPNEDSVSFEFDDTNLFSHNRFGGIDRVEGGPRINYGLNNGIFGLGSGFSSFFVGQSFRLNKGDDFDRDSGLDGNFSDVVGRIRIRPTQYINALYRFRVDKDDFSARRNEVTASAGVPLLHGTINYLSIDQQNLIDSQEPQDDFRDREEITFSLRSNITDHWMVRASTHRDLTSGGGALSHGFSLMYEDDCFKFRTDYSRAFTRDRDVAPTDTILFRFVFKTLGEVETSRGVN